MTIDYKYEFRWWLIDDLMSGVGREGSCPALYEVNNVPLKWQMTINTLATVAGEKGFRATFKNYRYSLHILGSLAILLCEYTHLNVTCVLQLR